jgi:hypothetical protein
LRYGGGVGLPVKTTSTLGNVRTFASMYSWTMQLHTIL